MVRKKAGRATVNASTEESKHLVENVISLREEYSRWMGQAADKGSRTQNESDLNFVNVFQQVKGILCRQDRVVPKGKRPDRKENSNPQEKEAANISEALSLEEPKDAVGSPNLWVSVPTGPKAMTLAIPKPVYHMESLYDDFLFSPGSFFQDLEAIREVMRNAWSGFRARHTELSAVSLLTNTASELIQRSTREYLDSIKRWPDAADEKDFIYCFHAHICKEGITGREKPGDYIHIKTYEQVEKISWPVSFFLEEN